MKLLIVKKMNKMGKYDNVVAMQPISPREIWEHEQYNFSDWMKNNLGVLAQRLGLELELQGVEVKVGPYRCDIFADEVSEETVRKVIIENQLEKSNHDHLGKCIVYEAGLDASIVIWIAPEFTEEHKRAINHLNDITDSNHCYYAVQLVTFGLSDGKKGYYYNVICEPNNARKAGENDVVNSRISLWTKFKDKLNSKNNSDIYIQHNQVTRNYFDVPIKGCDYLISVKQCDSKDFQLRLYAKKNLQSIRTKFGQLSKIGQFNVTSINTESTKDCGLVLETDKFEADVEGLVKQTIHFAEELKKNQ